MEKICLIEAGSYLIGIDTDVIISMQDVDSFIDGKSEDTTDPTLLACCLDQNESHIPQSEYSIIELKTHAEPLTLAVDRIVGAIKVPDHFAPLPLLYPKLASQCCPQILIHDEQPVLLLDEDALDTICTELKNDCYRIPLSRLQKNDNTTPPDDDLPVAVCIPDNEPEQPAAELDDAAFKSVVSWTITEYLKHGSNTKCVLRIDELPPECVHPSLLQGDNTRLLQRLIDKTLQKCSIAPGEKLQRLIKNSAGMKS